jgi:hypothetical protein
MKKAVTLFGLIMLLMLILSLLASVVTAEPIIIDTEKGVPGFRTEPARDLPTNWWYVHDHPDSSADGWFDTYAYPPGQGNGSFWYTISFPDMGEWNLHNKWWKNHKSQASNHKGKGEK